MSRTRSCKICKSPTATIICKCCQSKTMTVCDTCGVPVPTIRRDGKPYKRARCSPCTTRSLAHTRRIGVKCRVCDNRKDETKQKYQVCPECQQITSICPMCNNVMPKYKKQGRLRLYCSNSCSIKSSPITSETMDKIQVARKETYDKKGRRSSDNKLARQSKPYFEWRKAVYKRDDYTCQYCNKRGGELHPHHIKPFATHKSLRFEISNGVTLCATCHRKRHNHIFIGRPRKPKPIPGIVQLSLPTFEE